MRTLRPISTALVKQVSGRCWRYNAWVAAEICARLSEGEPLIKICRDSHMPHVSTVHEWVIDNVEGFAERYIRARKLGAEVYFERAMEIACDTTDDARIQYDRDGRPYAVIDGFSVQRAKLMIDTLKWSLAKIYPRRYGELSEKAAAEDESKQSSEPKAVRRQLTREEWLNIYAIDGEAVKVNNNVIKGA